MVSSVTEQVLCALFDIDLDNIGAPPVMNQNCQQSCVTDASIVVHSVLPALKSRIFFSPFYPLWVPVAESQLRWRLKKKKSTKGIPFPHPWKWTLVCLLIPYPREACPCCWRCKHSRGKCVPGRTIALLPPRHISETWQRTSSHW